MSDPSFGARCQSAIARTNSGLFTFPPHRKMLFLRFFESRLRSIRCRRPIEKLRSVDHIRVFLDAPAAIHVMLRRDMKANMDDNQLTSDPPPTASTEDEKRSPPPLVYRTNDVDIWVVEPPGGTVSAKGKRVFSGYRAQHQALTYAYEQFGSARFFPY